MLTAAAIVDDLVRELVDDGTDALTLDVLDARAREFGALAAAEARGSARHDIAGAIERHLTKVAQAVRAEAFRL